MAGRRNLGQDPCHADPEADGRQSDRLESGQRRQHKCESRFGGAQTGPNPTDRGKAGTKHHLIVDGNGIPLASCITGANEHEIHSMIPLVNSIPVVKFKTDRKRKTPKILQADKAYDSVLHAEALRRKGVKLEAAKRGQKTKRPLGRERWKVERTMAWLKNFRRLRVRYERRADIHEALLTVATIAIALKKAVALFC